MDKGYEPMGSQSAGHDVSDVGTHTPAWAVLSLPSVETVSLEKTRRRDLQRTFVFKERRFWGQAGTHGQPSHLFTSEHRAAPGRSVRTMQGHRARPPAIPSPEIAREMCHQGQSGRPPPQTSQDREGGTQRRSRTFTSTSLPARGWGVWGQAWGRLFLRPEPTPLCSS